VALRLCKAGHGQKDDRRRGQHLGEGQRGIREPLVLADRKIAPIAASAVASMTGDGHEKKPAAGNSCRGCRRIIGKRPGPRS
jgi:hypothetical protein